MAKYAQHFLSNRHAAERIVQQLGATPNDLVLEIGPGKGALTQLLLTAKSVTVVEIDPEMVDRLTTKFSWAKNIRIVHSDILEFDLSTLGDGFKVVGNLPYNLTSPILRKLSEWNGWSQALVMVQKEVGDRLCASAGNTDYGALTVGMNLTCAMERVFELSESSFNPQPHVKSAVVRLIRRERPLVDDVSAVQRVIQAAFQQRRKTILNSLSHGLKLEKEQIQKVLSQAGIDEGIRPERIPVDGFIALERYLRALSER